MTLLDLIIQFAAKPEGSWFGAGTELLWAAILAGINPCAAMPWTC